jgi:hypothetical protein
VSVVDGEIASNLAAAGCGIEVTHEYAASTWQRTEGDNWRFGVMIRGVIRRSFAQVYYDEDLMGPDGGWVWLLLPHKEDDRYLFPARGRAISLQDAVWAAEEALGLLKEERK